MSLDKSLRRPGGGGGERNVLSRAERMAILQLEGRWSEKDGVFNLPKTKFRRLPAGITGPQRKES